MASEPEQSGKRTLKTLEGFSLLELLVSVTILAIIVVVLMSMLNSSASVWRRGSSKIQAFQEARAAYEGMTRKISQATLNTYWDYDYDPATGNPTKYKRQSELAFVSGPQATLLSATAEPRTHAIFFQAPLGYTTNTAYANLRSLLNACGFFLEFGDDLADRPGFLTSGTIVPTRQRFRLKELWQPSENLSVYASTPATNWFAATPSSTLAENIIALVILPKLPEKEDPEADDLAPSFGYDSTDSSRTNTVNQLPPLVQVVMVAIDESSAKRFENGNTAPTYGVDWAGLFQTADKLQADLQSLEAQLAANNVTYQIFNSSIPIEGAKWSR
jgi:uncharacterized protein (TIGR02599 family)